MPPQIIRYRFGTELLTVSYRNNRDGSFAVQLNDRPYRARVFNTSESGIDFELDGRRNQIAITVLADRQLIHGPGGDIELRELPRYPMAERAEFRGALLAPMPGKVLSIAVPEGAQVEAGQLLLILEAMKMEHRITAPAKGTVKSLKIAEGDQVANGALLVVFEVNHAEH